MSRINIKHILFILGLAFLSCGNIYAQKKHAKTAKNTVKTAQKNAAKAEANVSSIVLEDVLPATAKLIIIDSVVCDKDKIFDNIPLTKDCGRITTYNKFFNNPNSARSDYFVYINDFEDKCFFKDSTANGKSFLYTAEKLGGKWLNKRILDELGNEYEDINYPYLMPDGVTLYFSARNKSNTFGGRDIYMTRLNTDSMRFYKPENIGLPYNSSADDYCCIIDDINSMGWIATNRHQPNGKACVYTFIPSDERWLDENNNITERKLESLAKISSIRETWVDKKAVEDAKNRLSHIKSMNTNATISDSFAFVINDNTIYRHLSDFKSPTGKELFTKLLALQKDKNTGEKTLALLRKQYSKAKAQERKQLSGNILKTEKDVLNKDNQITVLEKKIRNAENIKH